VLSASIPTFRFQLSLGGSHCPALRQLTEWSLERGFRAPLDLRTPFMPDTEILPIPIFEDTLFTVKMADFEFFDTHSMYWL
jgi:hypothetical protein